MESSAFRYYAEKLRPPEMPGGVDGHSMSGQRRAQQRTGNADYFLELCAAAS
jgi:hypothetical protein